jgi:transposase-like protein
METNIFDSLTLFQAFSPSKLKMSKSTISTFQLFETFPDQETARAYLEKRLWPNGVRCPVCGLGERITARKNGFYRCNQCKEDFTVRTGTIFERSHVPLQKWIYAMYLLVTVRKGISSLQLAKETGVSQTTAWFVLHRLREACGTDLTKLSGIIELDETYIGGKETNKHAAKKTKGAHGPVGMTAVLGMRERGGRVVAGAVDEVDRHTAGLRLRRMLRLARWRIRARQRDRERN